MLSSVLKFIVFIVILRLLFPFFKGLAGSVRGLASQGQKNKASSSPKDEYYSELTSYEIEDAEFEDIKED